MATRTLGNSYLMRLTNANHDGVTQQIDDRLQAFESDNQMLNALAVLMPSNEVTLLLSLLFSIEDRAKLYYISGGKTSSGGTAAATASQPSA